MKKIFTLFVALVAFAFCAKAQVLYENFDNGIPSTWTVIDNNNTGYPWEAVSQTLTNVANCPYTSDQFSYGGTGDCAVSWSYYPNTYTGDGFQGTSLNQDNYLISPAFTPVNGSVLSYYCMSFNGTNYPDDIMVKLSTGGTAASDFTVTLQNLTTVSWSEYTVKTIDLSSYAGQSVRIAFIHQSNDMFGLLLDEVTVSGATAITENNAGTVSVYPVPANNVVNVNATSNISNVEIYSISGQKVNDFTANGTSATINTENLSNGMYLMRINTENGTINKKFSVAR
jgi:hypothetical protein